MKIISTVKKIILAGALISLLTPLSWSTNWASAETYLHTPTSKEEIKAAEKGLKVFHKRYPDAEESDFITDNIQAPLVKYNPEILKIAKKKNGDGLRKIYIIDKKHPQELGKGIFTIGAGNIAITQGLINAKMAMEPGTFTPKPHKDYDIYALSSLAYDYAREAAHWYYGSDYTDKRANNLAMKLLDNVPFLSLGGRLMSDLRTAPEDMDREDRLLSTYNYLLEMSQNRVGFANDDIMTNQLLVADRHGDYWTVFAPPQYEVDALAKEAQAEDKSIMTRGDDRAYYVAGQIVWAMKNHLWDSSHVKMADAHKYFKELPKNIEFKAIVVTDADGRYKLIDWYLADDRYLTPNQLNDITLYIDGMKASFDDAEIR